MHERARKGNSGWESIYKFSFAASRKWWSGYDHMWGLMGGSISWSRKRGRANHGENFDGSRCHFPAVYRPSSVQRKVGVVHGPAMMQAEAPAILLAIPDPREWEMPVVLIERMTILIIP